MQVALALVLHGMADLEVVALVDQEILFLIDLYLQATAALAVIGNRLGVFMQAVVAVLMKKQ